MDTLFFFSIFTRNLIVHLLLPNANLSVYFYDLCVQVKSYFQFYFSIDLYYLVVIFQGENSSKA